MEKTITVLNGTTLNIPPNCNKVNVYAAHSGKRVIVTFRGGI